MVFPTRSPIWQISKQTITLYNVCNFILDGADLLRAKAHRHIKIVLSTLDPKMQILVYNYMCVNVSLVFRSVCM